MTNTTLSDSEIVFCDRMRPHIDAGFSVEDAARKVMQDDIRIFSAFCDTFHSVYVPTFDEIGTSRRTSTRPGDLIRAEITKSVYFKLRQMTPDS